MDVNQQAIAAMPAVTVSREYGSGGGEIAARPALATDGKGSYREAMLQT